MTYMCADLHLTHKQIHHYRGFDSTQAHDDFVEKRWLETITKKAKSPCVEKQDTIYILGDVSFSREGWERLDSWPGHKTIILGNHCTEYEHAKFISGLKTVKAVHGMVKYKTAWLTHAPLHPEHLRGKRNIHGHLHSHKVKDKRYLNVSLENTNMAPIHLDEILKEFERRKSLAYVYKTLGAKAFFRALLI